MAFNQENYVYLDWAATTPLCEEAARVMEPYFKPGMSNIWVNANANSLHTPGRNAFMAMEDVRMKFARTIGVRRPDEIIFTGGATEADNAAIFGLAEEAFRARSKGNKGFVGHVITSAIEHDAVLEPVKRLSNMGYEVTFLRPNSKGFITPEALEAAMQDNTLLVSIMYVNNEIGSVQDIKSLAAVAHKHKALFHTDAVQAFGKVSVDVAKLGVDAASFSAHKICGPKGMGALYLKARTGFNPMMLGGGQELGKRSGTQNVAGYVGFAEAATVAASEQPKESKRLIALRDKLYAEMCKLPKVRASVDVEPGSTAYAPHVVNVTVDGIESETLILQLDLKGFGVSGGSACASSSLQPSHVLTAIGMPGDRAICSLRVSMGRYTTQDDIDSFLVAFKEIAS